LITNLNIVGLIPARSGSKRVSNKNIKLCAGKPLLSYTCKEAKKSKYLNRIVLSTDDHKIKMIGKSYGAEAPFLRPAEISGDDVLMIDVVKHAYEALTTDDYSIDVFVLLQPTSPLREANDIDNAVEIFIRGDFDSVVSVVETPHIFSPQKLYQERGQFLVPYCDDDARPIPEAENRIFARNGPAVLVFEPSILETGSLYGARSAPYEMCQENSIDIDTPIDFKFAEYLLRQKLKGTVKGRS
jgi:CMP-N,N'-diacetyllegionaminic acid synthase